MTPLIRILVVDDHPVVRTGIRGMLSGQEDFVIVGEAGNGQEAVAQVKALAVDVVLMDLRMPVMDGITALKAIKADHPAVQVLILTTYDTDHEITLAVEAGASGYLRKDSPSKEVFRAIRTVASGGSALSPDIASRVLNQMRHPNSLSDREITIMQLVAHGETNKQIGRALHISEATVKTHLNHIYAKLSVPDRASAVAVAIARGYIVP